MKSINVAQRVPARKSDSPVWLKSSQQASSEPLVLAGNGGAEPGMSPRHPFMGGIKDSPDA